MPPLILHNVPDEELYVGDDGIQRPYAMLFPGYVQNTAQMSAIFADLPDFLDSPSSDGNPSVSRARRTIPETGSFGKSTRRSRSRTGTPAAKREDPTLAAADAIFSQFLADKAKEAPAESSNRKPSLSASVSQPNLSSGAPLSQIDGNAGPSSRYAKKELHKEPTEVILRGFKSTQQYAAIREYERIGGRICEDYPRDAPLEQRRYKNDIRDQAALRRKPMTAEEKAKALKFAGGEHWIKITFESAEAAEVAVEASPQTILGHLVYAELYRGVPPTSDEEIPANGKQRVSKGDRFTAQSLGAASGFATGSQAQARRPSSTLPRSFTTPSLSSRNQSQSSLSPPGSNASSQTFDSNTLSSTTGTATSGTITGFPPSQSTSSSQQQQQADTLLCERMPGAKRMQLLPAEMALLPQQSFSRRMVNNIPLVKWLSADIIGSAVPRTEYGEFDWEKASLYWKVVWWVDSFTGWFDICGVDKDD
jgi:hypothetical protein